METDNAPTDRMRAELARSLDCFTEAEVCVVAGVKPSTTDAWRKRGTGPEYIRFGREFLYPRKGLAEFLQRKAHRRGSLSAGDVL